MYNLDCLRCKKKVPEDFAQYSNHCATCLDLVREKNKQIYSQIEKLREEFDDFSCGKDLKNG